MNQLMKQMNQLMNIQTILKKMNQMMNITKKIPFHISQSVGYVSEKMSTNFGKDILITEQNIPLFHFSMNK